MSKMRKNKRTKYNPGAHRAARVTTWIKALLAGNAFAFRTVQKLLRRSASIKTQA